MSFFNSPAQDPRRQPPHHPPRLRHRGRESRGTVRCRFRGMSMCAEGAASVARCPEGLPAPSRAGLCRVHVAVPASRRERAGASHAESGPSLRSGPFFGSFLTCHAHRSCAPARQVHSTPPVPCILFRPLGPHPSAPSCRTFSRVPARKPVCPLLLIRFV